MNLSTVQSELDKRGLCDIKISYSCIDGLPRTKVEEITAHVLWGYLRGDVVPLAKFGDSNVK